MTGVQTCALPILQHFAIVAAEPDGNDEAGRQKLRLMPEQEVVDRAMLIAELAWDQLRLGGLMINVPSQKELKRSIKVQKEIDSAR